MKSKFMKKLVSLSLCAFLALGSLSSIKCFAGLRDIGIIGGSYENVVDAKIEYKQQHPEDQTEYECHHLISRAALKKWKDEIVRRGLANRYNEFLNDPYQNWAPSITMEKADHEQTLSYFYPLPVNNNQKELNEYAKGYINYQADSIISGGDIVEVLINECNFIQKVFGNKYDKALSQVWEYIDYLNFKKPINKLLIMNNPYDPNLTFRYYSI